MGSGEPRQSQIGHIVPFRRFEFAPTSFSAGEVGLMIQENEMTWGVNEGSISRERALISMLIPRVSAWVRSTVRASSTTSTLNDLANPSNFSTLKMMLKSVAGEP
jgi:hypothetical protein